MREVPGSSPGNRLLLLLLLRPFSVIEVRVGNSALRFLPLAWMVIKEGSVIPPSFRDSGSISWTRVIWFGWTRRFVGCHKCVVAWQ